MRKQLLDQFFPQALLPGVIEPYLHKGEWAVHQVLPVLLDAIGPADVMLMSYNISEDSLRAFTDLVNLRSMRMILDEAILRHKLDLLLFAASITPDIHLIHSHAKVLLCENDHYCFGIVGSANLNRVTRYESGFYFTTGRFYDYFRQQFDTIYNLAIPFG